MVDNVAFTACVDGAIFRSLFFCFWSPKTLVGSKGCAAGYAMFIEDSVGHVLMTIPYAEVWLLPVEEGEVGYQPNVFFSSLLVACVSFAIFLLGCRAEVLAGLSLMIFVCDRQ